MSAGVVAVVLLVVGSLLVAVGASPVGRNVGKGLAYVVCRIDGPGGCTPPDGQDPPSLADTLSRSSALGGSVGGSGGSIPSRQSSTSTRPQLASTRQEAPSYELGLDYDTIPTDVATVQLSDDVVSLDFAPEYTDPKYKDGVSKSGKVAPGYGNQTGEGVRIQNPDGKGPDPASNDGQRRAAVSTTSEFVCVENKRRDCIQPSSTSRSLGLGLSLFNDKDHAEANYGYFFDKAPDVPYVVVYQCYLQQEGRETATYVQLSGCNGNRAVELGKACIKKCGDDTVPLYECTHVRARSNDYLAPFYKNSPCNGAYEKPVNEGVAGFLGYVASADEPGCSGQVLNRGTDQEACTEKKFVGVANKIPGSKEDSRKAAQASLQRYLDAHPKQRCSAADTSDHGISYSYQDTVATLTVSCTGSPPADPPKDQNKDQNKDGSQPSPAPTLVANVPVPVGENGGGGGDIVPGSEPAVPVPLAPNIDIQRFLTHFGQMPLGQPLAPGQLAPGKTVRVDNPSGYEITLTQQTDGSYSWSATAPPSLLRAVGGNILLASVLVDGQAIDQKVDLSGPGPTGTFVVRPGQKVSITLVSLTRNLIQVPEPLNGYEVGVAFTATDPGDDLQAPGGARNGVHRLAAPVTQGGPRALYKIPGEEGALRNLWRHDYSQLDVVNLGRFPQGGGYDINCTKCVVALDRTLEGTPTTADPVQSPPADGVLRVQQALGGLWQQMRSYSDIVEAIRKGGQGSRGVVLIWRKDGTSHVFNVIYDRNGVVFIDGQTGFFASLETDLRGLYLLKYK